MGTACQETACLKRGYHHIPPTHLDDAEDLDPLVGLVADGYLLLRRIGAGAFGRVYLAEQSSVGVRAAIKVLTLQDMSETQTAHQLEKFRGEARALSKLSHPNIVRVFRFGTFQGGPFLALEFVEGASTLADEMDEKCSEGSWFDLEETRSTLVQLLDALAAAHDKGIVHRDIKPENLMLQHAAGDPWLLRLVDFGIAKFLEEGDTTLHTIGTPVYMAPEQLYRRQIGPWTDLYSVAVLACELLTGHTPFSDNAIPAVLRHKVDPSFDPGAAVQALGLGERHAAFFGKALAADPQQRYTSVATFRAALLPLLTAPAGPTTPPPAAVVASRPAQPAAERNAAFNSWLAREGALLGLAAQPRAPKAAAKKTLVGRGGKKEPDP